MSEKLRKEDWIVKTISHDTAVRFIEKHHYALSASRTSVYTFGLFRRDRDFFEDFVEGVSIWLPPTKNTALTISSDFKTVLTLSRLAIAPNIPKNACTFVLANSRKFIKRDGRFTQLVTFADTSQGHTGSIYKADNWEYLGKTKPTPVWINDKGQIMGAKRAGKNLTKNEMVALGFTLLGKFPKHKYRFNLNYMK